ncbi:DUF1877 family protein [Micromonospora sp. MS34]|uniref:DUF1877 family protein n=1 Tax=Micromonospora sp. MS34 TaxID=3385971 RepID=UPI0039A306F7
MSISLRMRRIPAEELDRGLSHLEAGFAATLDNAVYDAETESGVLCDIGEQWQFVHLVVTGERHQVTGPSGLPVLGGEPLGQVGPTDRDLILKLSPGDVSAAADFLRAVDLPGLMEVNRELLAERTGGSLPNLFLNVIKDHLADLRRFYDLAAEAGQAVVKRTYT